MSLKRRWARVRLAVLRRDNWRCSDPECGRIAREVHHVRDGESLRGDLRQKKLTDASALTSLCLEHHIRAHARPRTDAEDRWAALVADLD